jgi:hypothetical protein
MSFAAAARRLTGQAALLLGWRPAEFWSATPEELADAMKALGDAMVGGSEGGIAHPVIRNELDRLMEMHPDG